VRAITSQQAAGVDTSTGAADEWADPYLHPTSFLFKLFNIIHIAGYNPNFHSATLQMFEAKFDFLCLSGGECAGDSN